jgi:octaprenyl-diphosphate synthase
MMSANFPERRVPVVMKPQREDAGPGFAERVSLAGLQALVGDKLVAVEEMFRSELGCDVEVVEQAGAALSEAGGKRVRPLLTLLTFGALGYQGDQDVRYAVVLEYIHTATLIHDDVIDESELRRGKETLNARYGNSLTILIGDWVYTKSMDLALRDRDPDVLRILTDLVLRMVEGEILEIRKAGDLDMSIEQALEINRRKTAHLFSGCCRVAAHVARAGESTRECLARYGDRLGMAFQAVDDLLDYTSDTRTLGKPALHDLEEGRITLPTLYMMEADPASRELVARVVEDGGFHHVDREDLVSRATGSGALDQVRELARRYAREAGVALDALEDLPQGPSMEALRSLPEFILARSH